MVAIATAPSHQAPSRPSRPVLVVLPPVTRSGARIYRRRRLAVLGAALSLLVLPALVMAASGSSTPARPASAPAAPAVAPAAAVYVVQPGDTLWSIAHQVEPHADPRDVVDRLVELNGSGALQPGQRLRLAETDR
jgi:nucleoid-associated protein YgaU